jgi:hypothetical protein
MSNGSATLTQNTRSSSNDEIDQLRSALRHGNAFVSELDHLDRLALLLSIRYRATDDLEDLRESILYRRKVLRLIPVASPQHGIRAGDLGMSFCFLASWTHKSSDLAKAVYFGRYALAVLSSTATTLSRSHLMNQLSATLLASADKKELPSLYDESIALAESAISGGVPDPRLSSEYDNNLANAYRQRYFVLHQFDDLERSLQYSVKATASAVDRRQL